jgi:hypothetical protein
MASTARPSVSSSPIFSLLRLGEAGGEQALDVRREAGEHNLVRGILAPAYDQRGVDELPCLALVAHRPTPVSIGTSVGGSATGATLAPAPPRLLVRRLAGLAVVAAELARRLRLEPEAAADIFLWVR